MKGKQITFFATKLDIISVMKIIEDNFEIEYIAMGMFDSNKPVKYSSLTEIASIGNTNYGNWISFDNRFMIVSKNRQISVREVPQRHGGLKFVVDPMLNPISVELSTGGVHTQKENILIGGRLATLSDNDFSSKIFKAIGAEIKKTFFKINTVFVGREAEEKLKKGWRLTTNEKSSKEYDLTLS